MSRYGHRVTRAQSFDAGRALEPSIGLAEGQGHSERGRRLVSGSDRPV